MGTTVIKMRNLHVTHAIKSLVLTHSFFLFHSMTNESLYKCCGFCYFFLDCPGCRLCERERAMVPVYSRKNTNLHPKLMSFKNMLATESRGKKK